MPKRKRTIATSTTTTVQPTPNGAILDAPDALRASPGSGIDEKITPGNIKRDASDSPLSDAPESPAAPPSTAKRTTSQKPQAKTNDAKQDDETYDPEAEQDDEAAAPDEIKAAVTRPPPVNSSRLPLPFTGRLGYACLNTYLRFANPPVFCSRTTRIASILEHRHPLRDPNAPEHSTKNRPDKDQPADPARGQRFVEKLCLQNVHDMKTLIRWNERYNIKFLRLSSEAFPFASHAEYGYKLAPFAADALAEVGALAGKLGHRLTTHPGQFTQLGSPKASVIAASVRDLEYHAEMLSLLRLPAQLDRDAVMILHMGGVFGDKAATLARFRANYARLPPAVRRRLVLENDDVSWTVHDLLPVCQDLDIPLVLDYHHHNIVFDAAHIREGTHDIQHLYEPILATWRRKHITPKMHYSEPTPPAITPQQRRKHSPRVATLPPLPDGVDLMIEAKDKEQAVLELMRNFKLPGWDRFNDVVPHVRGDENHPVKPPAKRKKRRVVDHDAEPEPEPDAANADADAVAAPDPVPEGEINMGGPLHRVYWPPGMEDWLRPAKRVVHKDGEEPLLLGKLKPAQRKILLAQAKAEVLAVRKNGLAEAEAEAGNVDVSTTGKKTTTTKGRKGKNGAGDGNVDVEVGDGPRPRGKKRVDIRAVEDAVKEEQSEEGGSKKRRRSTRSAKGA